MEYQPKLTRLTLAGFIILSTYALLAILLPLPSTALMTPLTTLTGFCFAVLHAWQRLGWRSTLLFIVLGFIVALAFESIGVATGLVYGPYHYTEKLGPKFLGLVPYIIAVAWFMMMYPSYIIAEILVPGHLPPALRRLAVAALGGMVMTAWDVVMDPLMVMGGHWIWETQGAYFGVPLQNYWGWWLTTFVTLWLVQETRLRIPLFHKSQPKTVLVPDSWAIASYAFLGVNNIILGLSVGLQGPAMAGIFAMTPWVLCAWILQKERTKRYA